MFKNGIRMDWWAGIGGIERNIVMGLLKVSRNAVIQSICSYMTDFHDTLILIITVIRE